MKRYFAISAALTLLSMAALAVPANAAPGKSRHERRALRGAHTFSFYGTVVSATRKTLVVHTSSGRTLRFSAAELRVGREPLSRSNRRDHARHAHRQLAHAALEPRPPHGPLVTDVLSLHRGVIVLITESVSGREDLRVTVALPPANITVGESARGVVTEVQHDAFEMTTTGGTELRLLIAPRQLASLKLQRSDSVSVTYHQHAGVLVADHVGVAGGEASRRRTSSSSGIMASNSVRAVNDQMGDH